MLKAIFFISFLFTFSFSSNIKIAVAANVSYAINDLILEFNKQFPNTKVLVVLGGSGRLTAQIKNGAPYELFMSANMSYPDALYKEKIAITKPIVYAKGALAILSNRKQDFTNWKQLLQTKNIRKIAVANPKTAPYGKATIEALKNLNLYNKINHKFIYGESISQTVSYTATVASIGFIAKSALYSKHMGRFKQNINWVEINPKLYTPISQGIVILKKGKNNKEVHAFYDFVQTSQAKKIFKKFGYN
jgi:molybdate transport system substrate-binding protein